jgi:hypothetical protein
LEEAAGDLSLCRTLLKALYYAVTAEVMPRKKIPGAAAARAARYRKRKRQVQLPPDVTGLVSTSTDATTTDDDERLPPTQPVASQQFPPGADTQEVLAPELELADSGAVLDDILEEGGGDGNAEENVDDPVDNLDDGVVPPD